MNIRNKFVGILFLVAGCNSGVNEEYKMLDGKWTPILLGCDHDVVFEIKNGILHNIIPLKPNADSSQSDQIKMRLHDLKFDNNYRGKIKGTIDGEKDSLIFLYTPNRLSVLDFENEKLYDIASFTDEQKEKFFQLYDLEKCTK